MAKTRVFVSFDFDNDQKLKTFILAQAKNNDSPFEIENWSLNEPAPQKEWKAKALAAARFQSTNEQRANLLRPQ